MHRRSFLQYATALLFGAGSCLPSMAQAAKDYRISGPHTHQNLTIYFVHGTSASGPVPLTLQEAFKKGAVKVHETGNVNMLAIENLGREPIFVQSGDLVKGGKQDRVLTMSLVLPSRSGRIPIASFCVEEGRWRARGKENIQHFSSSEFGLPSLKAKIAMKAPRSNSEAGQPTATLSRHHRQQRVQTSSRQSEVWKSVSSIQKKLSRGLSEDVAKTDSPTSLQLALENRNLKKAKSAYVKSLLSHGEKDSDIIGYVFAINGKINSADIYPSNGLFRKLWPKLLKASATEAISEKRDDMPLSPPSTEVVKAFLEVAERGQSKMKPVTSHIELETRDAKTALFFETKLRKGAWVHRNYLAK